MTAVKPLTILIAARDEEERIAATVEALREQFPDAEVIVADDGSRDATAVNAERAGATILRLPRRGKGQALSAAEQVAPPGDLLLLDADVRGDVRGLCAGTARGLRVARFARQEGGGVGLAKGAARALIALRGRIEVTEPLSGQRWLDTQARAAVFPLAPGFGAETRMTIDAARAGVTVEEVALDLEHRATGRDLRGFVHRGRQLVDLLLACGPLRVNHRGLRVPIVGWLTAVNEPVVAAIGLVDDLWSGRRAGLSRAPARPPHDRRPEARRDPALWAAADTQPLGGARRRPLGERAQPARHPSGPCTEGVPRCCDPCGSAASGRRPAHALRSSRDDDARGHRSQRARRAARLEFRGTHHG